MALGFLDAGIELAVGEGARTAFAELGIGGRIKRQAPFPKAKGVGGALLHRLAALQQKRPVALLGQKQSREIAAGPGTHHHGPGPAAIGVGRWRWNRGAHQGIGRGHHPRIAAQLAEHRGFIRHRHIQAVHQLNGALVARIHAAAKQLQLTESLKRQLQALGHRFGQCLRRVIQRQGDLVNANQGGATSSSSLQFGRRQPL